jgi:hypothetical protein
LRIARHSGCVIEIGEQLHDGTRSYEVKCPSHAAKVQLLANLAEYDSRDPEIVRLSEKIASVGNGEPEKIAALVHAFVRDGVAHLPEPREKFQPTGRTLALGIGDCDDTARAVYALAKGAGLRPALLTLGDPPRHVAAGIQLGGVWRWADASLPARFGEHPIAAAKRLGLKVREDLQMGQAGKDNGSPGFNLPNLITIAGFSLGVAWSQGGPDWMGLASIAADDIDGYVARKTGTATEFGGLLDWATDQVLTPLVWGRMELPWKYYPPVAVGQVAARQLGIKPVLPVAGSLRAGLMLADMGRRWWKRRKQRRRR